jgi:tetratricopeptide (TPR) repeat protein
MRNIIPSLRDALARAATDKPGVAKREPELAAKLIAEGTAAQKKKDMKTAVQRFEKARAADPLSWEAAWNYAKALPAAEADKKPGDKTKLPAATVVARTLDAYNVALDAKPASRETCMAAARFALQNRRPQAACDFMSHALAHFPDDKSVLDLYIEALGKLGTADGAKRARLYRAYRQEL